MLEILTAAGLVVAGSTLCGAALWQLVGLSPRSPVAPAAGFAALLIAAALTITLPGRGILSAAVVAALILVSLGYLQVRRVTRTLSLWMVSIPVVVELFALLPFAVSGRTGLLGVGTNDDMVEHLLAAWTLQGKAPLDSSKLLASGYPVGPHSLAATIAAGTGMSLEHAFTGLILAVPALLALAALGLLGVGPRALRLALAAGVGLCYLQAAYLVESSFKEPMEALMLVAFAACIYELEHQRARTPASALPLGVLAGGSVYIYSYLGLAWLGVALVVWATTHLALARTSIKVVLARASSLVPTFAVGAGTLLVLAAPQISRMLRFAHSPYNHETATVLGDLYQPLSAREALGIWPRLDYRLDAPLTSVAGALGLAAAVAVVVCLLVSARRRDLTVPSAFVAAAALYGLSAVRASPYTAAKALAIFAPTVTLLLGRQLLLTVASSRGSWRTPSAVSLAILLAAGGYSDFEVLRDGPVGPGGHAEQLASLRRSIGQRPTLFLGSDAYVEWELRGANVVTPPTPLSTRAVVPLRRAKARESPVLYASATARTTTNRLARVGLAVDFDSVPAGVLNRFAFVILPRSSYTSAPPANWRLVKTTASYGLWSRTGPALPRQTLTEGDNPGTILDCRTAAGRRISRLPGAAMVEPIPVVGEPRDWKGPVGYAGKSARQSLQLSRGTWAISLQYDSAVQITVTGPGLHAFLPVNLDPLGPYWYVGDVNVAKPGGVTVVVSYKPLSLLGRLLGAVGLTRVTGRRVLGRVTATRVPSGEKRLPLRRACGRYVEWYRTYG